MKVVPFAVMVLVAGAVSVQAKVPFLNATCPGNIEVHADEGGPVYINGNEASLHTFNDNYYEAKQGHLTISLSVNPDGSADVSYTARGGANGICTVAADDFSNDDLLACPPDVSEANRADYPGCD